MSDMLVAALNYASRGIPVFPCDPKTKKPIPPRDIDPATKLPIDGTGGFKKATTDVGTIRKWWSENPRYMVAMPTGPITKVWVLDPDKDEAKGKDGPAELKALEAKHGALPRTVRAVTARGKHLYFKWNGIQIRNTEDHPAPGIDVRGDGGYVILPPSQRADGFTYTWDYSDSRTAAEAPTWLTELILKKPEKEKSAQQAGGTDYGRKELGSWCWKVQNAKADGGSRYKTLLAAATRAGSLIASGDLPEEFVRAQLEAAGAALKAERPRDFHRAIDDGIKYGREHVSESKGKEKSPPQATLLLQLAADAQLFHTPDGTGYAQIEVDGHKETWPIRSKGFKRWLDRRYYAHTNSAPNSDARQAALGVIEAKAHFDGEQCRIHLRVAQVDESIYIDLANSTWQAIEIDASGWRIIDDPPVSFRRAAGMKEIPVPVSGGSIEELRPFLNLKGDSDFVLIVAWLLAAMRGSGPYPVLALAGEQGTAKSTLTTILRALIDPTVAPLKALPREDRDLFIAANNGWVLTFDNISGLPTWISDTLCRLSTGGGFSVRQLYTDQDEILFESMRPITLNGIEDIVTRQDLADRTIFLTLEPIPEDKRRSMKDLLADFEKVRPRILGALLDAVAHALACLPDTKLDRSPRMADFAYWACACESSLWTKGTFMAAYDSNRAEMVTSVIESDPVSMAVQEFMATKVESKWEGTAKELLNLLNLHVGETAARAKAWPATPKGLSGRLRRAATFLRKAGIEIRFSRVLNTGTRVISIKSSAQL